MKKILKIIITISILILLVLGMLSMVLFNSSAKYTNYKEMNHYYESSEMYISSDQLTSENSKYTIINYYNLNNIDFSINNSLGNEFVTNYDIDYDIECTIKGEASNNYQCIIDNSDSNKISDILINNSVCTENANLSYNECISQGFSFEKKQTTNNHTFKLVELMNNGNAESIEVEIILTTTKPFTKILKGTYILNLGYEYVDTIKIELIKDYKTSCNYKISNNFDTEKTIKLKIDTNNILIDDTQNIYINRISNTFNANNYINSFDFKLSGKSNTIINFYKTNFESNCNTTSLTYTLN